MPSRGRRRAREIKVIFHAPVPSIQRGLLAWHATQAKVVKMYALRNNTGSNIFATVKVISGE
jgi:hypothetical protein